MAKVILSHFSATQVQFDLTKIYPIEDLKEGGTFKPHGLWLSDEADHGWSKWCVDEGFGLDRLRWSQDFELDTQGITVLSSPADIAAFSRQFRVELWPGMDKSNHYVDWKRVMMETGGLLITPYCWKSRMNVSWYYGWDCASACIWDLSKLKVHGAPQERNLT